MSLQLLAILTAAGGLGLLALTHNAAAEYFMFSALIATVMVSYASSRLSTRALGWRRKVADRVFEDEPIGVQLEVSNRGRFPRFLLDIGDSIPAHTEAEGERDFVVSSLWPGERVTFSYTVRAPKRGVYVWDQVRVLASDPFGIFRRFASAACPTEAVVYPKPLELHGSLSRAGVEMRGQSTGERARGVESGLDFYGIRDYCAGDELRRIHWPATAHHSRLMVIEFDRGSSQDVAVVLDTMAGTDFGEGLETGLEVGVRAAASLAHWALASEGRAYLAAATPQGPIWATADRADDEHEILEVLARVKSEGAMPASALVLWAAQRLTNEVNLVLITASPDDALAAAVGTLGRRHLPFAVLLLDARSFDPRAPETADAMPALEAVGARVVPFRRGGDLAEALRDVLVTY